MMKLKLETNLHVKKHFMDEMFDGDMSQTNFMQSLLTPHLNLKTSIQVPIVNAVNSKGFFKANKSNKEGICLELKSLGLSGKKKATLMKHLILLLHGNYFLSNSFHRLFAHNSSLSSSMVINLITN